MMRQLLAFAFCAATTFSAMAQTDSLSYRIGTLLGSSVNSQNLPVADHASFLAGVQAALDGNISPELLNQAQAALAAAMKKQQEMAQSAARSEGEKFLTENAKRDEVTVTASGLQYEVLTEGDGSLHPAATDRVTVHYTGKNLDGSVFDSSVQRGQPATFGLNQVISGWTEGVQLMTPGAKYRFYIPSDLAYGERGAGSDIAPGATLIFDVELISVN